MPGNRKSEPSGTAQEPVQSGRIESRSEPAAERRQARTPIAAAQLLLALSAAGAACWASFEAAQALASAVRHDRRFELPLNRIQIDPVPAWIKADLLEEVRALGALPAVLDTSDPQLASQLYHAFAMHPWISSVRSVQVRGRASVRLDVEYRKPVALVRTAAGLQPIDANGVLLPLASFAEPESYLVVEGVAGEPSGPAGTKWAEPAVQAAAAVAAAICPHHQRLGLLCLDMTRFEPTLTGSSRIYLLTLRGNLVRWGRPPNTDHPAEVPAADKLERLLQYAARYGSLDYPPARHEIDLTPLTEIVVRPIGSLQSKPANGPGTGRTDRQAEPDLRLKSGRTYRQAEPDLRH
jgi:hypothetical protein